MVRAARHNSSFCRERELDTEVVEAPQGWLLDVAADGGGGEGARHHLIPFIRAVVERVDRAERLVVIAPPAGLLEI